MSHSNENAGKEVRPKVSRTPVSLATLSEHLGLSRAAISRVLNGAPAAKSIPKITQDRIFAAARELRYRPNVLARSLRRGHSMTIGVLVPEISEGYTTLVLSGLERGLREAGYVFLLVSHHHEAAIIERSQMMLTERAVDGIVAIDTALTHLELLPAVAVSCPNPQQGMTSITINEARAAELAIEHLKQQGHKRIAIIKGQSFSSDAEPRWQAICDAALRSGIPIHPELVTELEEDAPSNEPGYRATQRLLAGTSDFTALFAFNDVSAIGAIRALREAGLRVPHDVSVIGFDDVQSAAFQNPGLTTIRQPLHTMGMIAARAIIGLIDAPGAPATEEIIVEPELIVRESTRPPAARDPRTKPRSIAR